MDKVGMSDVNVKSSDTCCGVEALEEKVSELSLVRLLRNRIGCVVWSPLCGECRVIKVGDVHGYPIQVTSLRTGKEFSFTDKGLYLDVVGGECVLWPAKGVYTWDILSGLVRWRAKLNGEYWYVNSEGKISRGIDTQELTHDDRWDIGNYFDSTAAALVAATAIKTTFWELLTEEQESE